MFICRPRATSSACARSATSTASGLIFDEVITAWGRLGYASAAERMGIMPDLTTMARAYQRPCSDGSAVCRDGIYEAFMEGPEHVIELFHGET